MQLVRHFPGAPPVKMAKGHRLGGGTKETIWGGVWGGGDQGRKGSSRWSCHKPGQDFLLDFLCKAVLPCRRCNRVTPIHKHLYLTRFSHFADEEIEIRGLKPQNDGTPLWGEHLGIPVWKGCRVCPANDVGVSASAPGSSTTTQA